MKLRMSPGQFFSHLVQQFSGALLQYETESVLSGGHGAITSVLAANVRKRTRPSVGVIGGGAMATGERFD